MGENEDGSALFGAVVYAGLVIAPLDEVVGVVDAEVGSDEVAEGFESASEVVVIERGAGAI